jgi:hypothetical protein
VFKPVEPLFVAYFVSLLNKIGTKISVGEISQERHAHT